MVSLLSSFASVTNIWGLFGVICVAVALVVVRLKVNRFKELLKHIDQFPEKQRLEAVRLELNQIPPPNLSAEQYIKFKSQPYNFAFKCLIVLLVAGIIGMTILTGFSIYHPMNSNVTPKLSPPEFIIKNVEAFQQKFSTEKSSSTNKYDLVQWPGMFEITNITDKQTTITDFSVDWGKVKLPGNIVISLESFKYNSSDSLSVEVYDKWSDLLDVYANPNGKTRSEINQITSDHFQELPVPFLAREKKYIIFNLLLQIKHGSQVISEADSDKFTRDLATSLRLSINQQTNRIKCAFENHDVYLTTSEGKIEKTVSNIFTWFPGCELLLP